MKKCNFKDSEFVLWTIAIFKALFLKEKWFCVVNIYTIVVFVLLVLEIIKYTKN